MSAISAGRTRVTLGLCLLASCCEGYDLQAAAICGSGIAREFAPTASQLGTLFSASTLGSPLGARAAPTDR